MELARARVAARLHMPDEGTRLLRTADTLEENAHRALLDADVAYARLAQAACEANEGGVAEQARARSKYCKVPSSYPSRRRPGRLYAR